MNEWSVFFRTGRSWRCVGHVFKDDPASAAMVFVPNTRARHIAVRPRNSAAKQAVRANALAELTVYKVKRKGLMTTLEPSADW